MYINVVIYIKARYLLLFGAVVERSADALIIAGSIPALNKYLYGLQIVVPGVPVCVCDFSLFVNAPMILEIYIVRNVKSVYAVRHFIQIIKS